MASTPQSEVVPPPRPRRRRKLTLLNMWGRGWEWVLEHYDGWLNTLAEHRNQRNQLFYSAGDFRAALVMCTVANPRVVWRMGTLLLMYGAVALVPYLLAVAVLIPTVTWTELYAGYFPGVGIVASTRRSFPILAGLGLSITIYGSFQIVRDFGDLVDITYFATQLTNFTHYREHFCPEDLYPGQIGKLYHNPHKHTTNYTDGHIFTTDDILTDSPCLSLSVIGKHCRALVSFSNQTLVDGGKVRRSPPRPYAAYESVWEESGTFDFGTFLANYSLLFIIAALTSITNRVYTRWMKWIMSVGLVVQLVLLVAAGSVRHRIHTEQDCPEVWGDLQRVLAYNINYKQMVTRPAMWVGGGMLAVEALGCGQGQVTGLGRRMAQGRLLYRHLITLSMAAVFYPVVWAMAWILAAPTFVPLNHRNSFRFMPQYLSAVETGTDYQNKMWYIFADLAQFDHEWMVRLHPWMWTLKLMESMSVLTAEVWFNSALQWVVLGTVALQTQAMLFYQLDAVRVAILEWCDLRGWSEGAEEKRKWISLGILAVLALFAALKTFWAFRHVEEFLRCTIWEILARLVFSITTLSIYWHFYGGFKVMQDMALVTSSEVYKSKSFLGPRVFFNKYLVPCCSMFLVLTAFGCRRCRRFVFDLYGLPAQTSNSLRDGVVNNETREDLYGEVFDSEWNRWQVMALGGVYASLPFLVLGVSTALLIYKVRSTGGLLKPLSRPNKHWGPSEVRFWTGRYQHLLQVDGQLEEEKVRMQAKGRQKKGGGPRVGGSRLKEKASQSSMSHSAPVSKRGEGDEDEAAATANQLSMSAAPSVAVSKATNAPATPDTDKSKPKTQ